MNISFCQTDGVWRTSSGNTLYHHFARSGGGAAVYINQALIGNSFPILRLSSGAENPNANVKFTFENNGNLGIGIISPSSKLHVRSSGTLGGKYNKSLAHTIIGDGVTDLLIDGNEIYSNETIGIGNGYQKDIAFRNVDAAGYDDLLLIKGNGNIGINTSSPSAKLHIKSSNTIGTPANFNNAYLKISDNTNAQLALDPNQIYASGQLHIQTTGNNSMFFYTNDTKRVMISGSGNLGIGTTSPSEKLEVNGTIRSKEVKVEASPWPDYVFEPDYDLQSLEELEQYIQKEKHLPEIPSAKEMEANGVQLGEMNMLLLKKIEELTIHLIEKEKQIEELTEKVSDLYEKIDNVSRQLPLKDR